MTGDPLTSIKQVLILHLLRQQVEADLLMLRSTPLHLLRCYVLRLEELHADLLRQIGDIKRRLRQQGVRIIRQQKSSLDFHIAYLQKGYENQHCFLLATLQAEAHKLFSELLGGQSHGGKS